MPAADDGGVRIMQGRLLHFRKVTVSIRSSEQLVSCIRRGLPLTLQFEISKHSSSKIKVSRSLFLSSPSVISQPPTLSHVIRAW